MKIALMGYGKMGKLIEQLAVGQGHDVIVRFSTHQAYAPHLLTEVDVAIDFSAPACLFKHLDLCKQYGINLIIGTTGWEEHQQEVKNTVLSSQIGCLYSPNFSIGIYLFMQIVEQAAQLINPFEEYDVGGIEYHHRQKVDHPSGTAKALARQVVNQMDRLDQLSFSSVRCGYMPGTHSIHFDGPVDTITLTHQARNREGFAYGALKAAEWIKGKKGFFTLEDMLNRNKD